MERERLLEINRLAWNEQVARGNRWTRPVDSEAIQEARRGNLEIVLTPNRTVPGHWFPRLSGARTLMLASGGGQQAPLVAATGAEVTVVDLSDDQLKQDELVAARESLRLTTVRSSMDDLSMFPEAAFDLVIQPCSNCFVPDLEPVWREVARVTKIGATLLVGFCNPLIYLFDETKANQGVLEVEYALPYSDEKSLSAERVQELISGGEPLMFGHTLTEQIALQLRAGFAMVDLYEDDWGEAMREDASDMQRLDQFTPSFIATRSTRI